MTCLSVSSYLRKNYLDDTTGALFEEASLNALCKTFLSSVSVIDLRLLIDELPRILAMPYVAVNSLVKVCLEILPKFLNEFRTEDDVKSFEELNYLMRMLRTFSIYRR